MSKEEEEANKSRGKSAEKNYVLENMGAQEHARASSLS